MDKIMNKAFVDELTKLALFGIGKKKVQMPEGGQVEMPHNFRANRAHGRAMKNLNKEIEGLYEKYLQSGGQKKYEEWAKHFGYDIDAVKAVREEKALSKAEKQLDRKATASKLKGKTGKALLGLGAAGALGLVVEDYMKNKKKDNQQNIRAYTRTRTNPTSYIVR